MGVVTGISLTRCWPASITARRLLSAPTRQPVGWRQTLEWQGSPIRTSRTGSRDRLQLSTGDARTDAGEEELMAKSKCCGAEREKWNDGTWHCSECGGKN